MIEAVLASASPAIAQAGRTRLTLADATAIINAAQQSAAAKKVRVTIVVVDPRGDVIALERVPGASAASVDASIGKAMLSAVFMRPSGTFTGGATNPGSPITALHEASGGRLTFLPGGLPVVRGGRLIGAVAVGGATPQQDEAIATDGAAAIP